MAEISLDRVGVSLAAAIGNSPLEHIPGVSKVTRFGNSCLADESFFAWTSGDIERMRAAVSGSTNAIDRHHLLSSLVEKLFESRVDSPKAASELVRVATIHLREFPSLLPELQRDAEIRRDDAARRLEARGDKAASMRVRMEPPHWGVFSSHHRLFQVLQEQQQWDALSDAADIALSLGLIGQAERQALTGRPSS